MLGVIQLAGASGVLVEDVVDVFEGLFEHVGALGAGRVSGWRLRWVRRRCIRDFCGSGLPSPAPILSQDKSWGNTPAANDGHALSEVTNQIGWKLDFFRSGELGPIS